MELDLKAFQNLSNDKPGRSGSKFQWLKKISDSQLKSCPERISLQNCEARHGPTFPSPTWLLVVPALLSWALSGWGVVFTLLGRPTSPTCPTGGCDLRISEALGHPMVTGFIMWVCLNMEYTSKRLVHGENDGKWSLTIKFGATVAYFQTNPDGKPNNRPTIWGCFIHSIYGDFGHGYWVYHMNVFDMFIHNWGDRDAPPRIPQGDGQTNYPLVIQHSYGTWPI